ncbi:MAG: calcium/proton exchanger [Planctomycetota bacterium]
MELLRSLANLFAIPRTVDGVYARLLWLVPISILCHLLGAGDIVIFIVSIFALVPLARYIARATESAALQSNHTIGGLLNATFGNLIELFIAIFALRRGLVEVVKASIIGSIVENVLLLIGVSMFFGGLKYSEQRFNRYSAGVSSTMLIICTVGLAIPSVYAKACGGAHMQTISSVVSAVLAAIYLCGLVFALVTHRHLFDTTDEMRAIKERPEWPLRKAVLILAVMTMACAYESGLMVSRLEAGIQFFGFTHAFVGAVIVAILTNVAEKTNAVIFARKNLVNLSIEIGTSSAIQIALFVVPILVFAGVVVRQPFFLDFTTFQLLAMVFAVTILNSLAPDGRCNWLEGSQLIAVYLIIATVFYFIE